MQSTVSALGAAEIAAYRRDGFLVVPELLAEEEIAAFLGHEQARTEPTAFGLQGHRVDPQYRYLATHPKVVARAQNSEGHASWETEHTMSDRDGRKWTQQMVSFEIEDIAPESILRLTVPRGSGVFFTGMTIHGSYANRSEARPRIAFATHYIHE